MDRICDARKLAKDAASLHLFERISENETNMNLSSARLFYDFPLYRDNSNQTIKTQLMLVSKNHGVFIFGASIETRSENFSVEFESLLNKTEELFALVYSKLIRNKKLRKSRAEVNFPISMILYFPFIKNPPENIVDRQVTAFDFDSVRDLIMGSNEIAEETYLHIISTIEGSNGIKIAKMRTINNEADQRKGVIANKIESQIAYFDDKQLCANTGSFDGFLRIKGIAGSGKTVVLAMKAALTHLRYPDANIVITFYTRSLHQIIKKLIETFYRQYDEKEPDWKKISIMQAWGGKTIPGLYHSACLANNAVPISYSEAIRKNQSHPFDYVCKELMKAPSLAPMFDYIFIDEGQDFPTSFIKLCTLLAENERVVYAYDELQTIFQVKAPTPQEILGEGRVWDDVTLYKCYRNPREILVIAHAIGFGFYGEEHVQRLENKEHWEDLGYDVIKGEFRPGTEIIVERPSENTMTAISDFETIEEIVKCNVFKDFSDEVTGVVKSIKEDLRSGLRADDILVIVVDDKNVKEYLKALSESLMHENIGTNDIHTDVYGIRDFVKEDCVTLSTIHKAKGNESLMVYILGVDALYSSSPKVRERNMLFTAMTRAKGWVRISRVGAVAGYCCEEIKIAKENFPKIKFIYPTDQQIKVMTRDLSEKGEKQLKMQRILDAAIDELGEENVKRFLEQRSIQKKSD